MANLSSKKTGLPFIVWISSGQGVRHAARVKVAREMADLPDNMTSVSIASPATIQDGPPLPPADLRKLEAWIALNREPLLDYWNCMLATDEVMERLRGGVRGVRRLCCAKVMCGRLIANSAEFR
jgi:hypothetical protein